MTENKQTVNNDILLEVRNLKKYFPIKTALGTQKGAVKAVDDVSFSIKKGTTMGLVGESGCGKSTLIRVLLGFEKPQSGSVYYDMQDMEGIDLRSLRRRIGVVLQNGKLFSGDIYSNIVISAPWLTVDDAWKAAEQAGFAEDIRKMPMGMWNLQ